MKGRALTFGAISIVNAIASGRGATAGVGLRTVAEVEVRPEPGRWRVRMNSENVHSKLAVQVINTVLRRLNHRAERFSGEISTSSEIPWGVGLKSSSSSSVAIALAALASLDEKRLATKEILDCSVDASLRSGASITGALDDAASCLLGGVNHADNVARRLLSSKKFSKPLKVVLLIPNEKSRRASVEVTFVRKFSRLAARAFKMSAGGDHWGAMTVNGLLYSSIYGYDPDPAMKALARGALGAGLSGTGPAVAAVFEGDSPSIKTLITEWRGDGGTVISTRTNNQAGTIIEDD